MDLKEIRQIIEMMKRHDLSLFHLERDGMKIKLRKGVDFDTLVKTVSQGGGGFSSGPPNSSIRFDPLLPATGAADADGDDLAAAVAAAAGPPAGPTMKSPMVGTFYRCPGPNEPPFKKDGDRIAEGEVICIIEAMKVMNEIKSDMAGVIVRSLVNDGTPVQYGQPVFEIRPA